MSSAPGGFYAPLIAENGSYKTYLDGEWKTSESNKLIEINNPSKNTTAFRVQGPI